MSNVPVLYKPRRALSARRIALLATVCVSAAAAMSAGSSLPVRLADFSSAHAAESPLGKNLDPYQWLLFIAAHSERHTKQMLEVKADPNFPKS